MVSTFLAAVLFADQPKPAASPSPRTPLAAFRSLVEGNARFVSNLAEGPHRDAETRRVVAGGQTPHTIVVTCADSRLSPELIFDQGLGDLFVVRVAGNIVDTHALASMEYAAEHLGARLVLVLGHEQCGAVAAACDAYAKSSGHDHSTGAKHDANDEHANLSTLLHAIFPAVGEATELHAKNSAVSVLDGAIQANVNRTILTSYEKSPMLRRMALTGDVQFLGGVYDLDSGHADLWEAPAPKSGFVRVHEGTAPAKADH